MSDRLIFVAATCTLVVMAGLAYRFGQTGVPTELRAASDAALQEIWTVRPQAVVVDPVFDLGVLSPGDRRSHRFTVRNTGTADLVLTLGSTSCKCTLAKFDEIRIAPGCSDVVELEWHAEQPQFRFRQGATINTNDPALPQFELTGEGSVRVKLAAVPEAAYLADVPRNTLRTLNVLVYSQAFAEVEIGSIESSSAAITAAVAIEPPQTAPPVQETRFLCDLVVTLHPQAQPGHYDGVLRIAYRGRLPNGTAEADVFELPVSYDVVGDISLYGRDLLGRVLTFGSVSQATGAKKQVYLHVRGDDADGLQPTVKRTTPDILQVQIGEAQRLSPTITRFPITVEVPAGAPLQAFTESSLGEVELTTTHANKPSVRFPVSLIVVP